MAASIFIQFKAFENYVSDSNECVKFKLVTCADDLIEDFEPNETTNQNDHPVKKIQPRIPPFKPEMSYQFFGDNENIFGYQDLTVKIYYSCAQLNIYLGLQCKDRLSKNQTGGVEPDDVLKIISTKYETKVTFNLNEFSSSLAREKSFIPYGELIDELCFDKEPEQNPGDKRLFSVYKANNLVPGFVAYHERMQTFLMWYIESASYIDIDDERWDFFVVYEKLPISDSPKEFQYCFVGYATVYRYYAYPQNTRPRISQFIILPPFRRIGLGSKLLEIIYNNYNVKSVVDITVEDPSEDFQRMRDVVNCKLCMKLDSFSVARIQQGWSKEMVEEAKEKFKLNAKQTRRVYEILKLKNTNLNDPDEYRSYRLSIKQRLNAPYNKQISDIEKLHKRKAITEAAYASLMKTNQIPREYRINMLNKQYEEIEKEYLEIIEKLEKP